MADWTKKVEKIGYATAMVERDEMTPGQVADYLGIAPTTVRRWEKAGILKPYRRLPGSGYRRYRRADVEAVARRMETGPGDEGNEGT